MWGHLLENVSEIIGNLLVNLLNWQPSEKTLSWNRRLLATLWEIPRRVNGNLLKSQIFLWGSQFRTLWSCARLYRKTSSSDIFKRFALLRRTHQTTFFKIPVKNLIFKQEFKKQLIILNNYQRFIYLGSVNFPLLAHLNVVVSDGVHEHCTVTEILVFGRETGFPTQI